MKKFTFKEHKQSQLEEILKYQKRKLRKQQIIFTTIFFLIVCAIIYYLADSYLYAQFDGFISLNTTSHRAICPLYITKIYHKEGEIVKEGDTLYTYINLDFFTNMSNLSFSSNVEMNYMNANEKVSNTRIEINSLKDKIKLMEEEIKKEEQNVRYGVTSTSTIGTLNRQIIDYRNQLKELMASLVQYQGIRTDYSSKMREAGLEATNPLETTLKNINLHLSEFGRAVGYGISHSDVLITQIEATPGSVLLTGEHVMEVQSLNIDNIGLHCEAYVTNEDLTNIYEGKKVEIIINDDVSYDGIVTSVGMHVSELPEEYRNAFHRENKAMCAIIQFKEGTVIPLPIATDNLPVKIRTMRRESKDKLNNERIKYIMPKPILNKDLNDKANEQ